MLGLPTKASSTKLTVLRNKKCNEMKDCFEVMSGQFKKDRCDPDLWKSSEVKIQKL